MAQETLTYVRVADDEGVNEDSEEDSVEIERKFLVPPDVQNRIQHHGGRLIVEEKFDDVYFDRSDYGLLRSDIWLRSRDGVWEMNHGEAQTEKDPGRRVLDNKIIQSAEEILQILRTRGLLNDAVESDDLEMVVNSTPFRSFAKSQTTRKVFGVPANGNPLPAKISIVATDFGPALGEVLVSVDDNQGIPSALRTIAHLSMVLGKMMKSDNSCVKRG